MLAQPVTVSERFAARPVDLPCTIREVLPGVPDRPPKRRADGDALVCVENRGLPEIGPRQAAVLLPQRLKPTEISWRRHRLGCPHHVLEPLGVAEHVGVGGGREPPVVVQIAELAPLGIVENHRAVAAENTRVHRLDDRQCRGDRDGGVKGIPAQFEYLDPSLRSSSMRRRDHPPGADRTIRPHDGRLDRVGCLGRAFDNILGAAGPAEAGEHDRREQDEYLSGLHGCLTGACERNQGTEVSRRQEGFAITASRRRGS